MSLGTPGSLRHLESEAGEFEHLKFDDSMGFGCIFAIPRLT